MNSATDFGFAAQDMQPGFCLGGGGICDFLECIAHKYIHIYCIVILTQSGLRFKRSCSHYKERNYYSKIGSYFPKS